MCENEAGNTAQVEDKAYATADTLTTYHSLAGGSARWCGCLVVGNWTRERSNTRTEAGTTARARVGRPADPAIPLLGRLAPCPQFSLGWLSNGSGWLRTPQSAQN